MFCLGSFCCGYASKVVNSLTPGRFQFNFRKVIFKLTLVNGGWGISYEIALRWMPQDFTDDKSTLVQVMAWCRQATSHYLSQCWPRCMSPNGITRPQWVKKDIAEIITLYMLYPIKYGHSFVVLCFVVVRNRHQWIHEIHFPILFRVTELPLGQSYDYPSARVITWKIWLNHTCI